MSSIKITLFFKIIKIQTDFGIISPLQSAARKVFHHKFSGAVNHRRQQMSCDSLIFAISERNMQMQIHFAIFGYLKYLSMTVHVFNKQLNPSESINQHYLKNCAQEPKKLDSRLTSC